MQKPSATTFQVLLHTMCVTRNVQQWIMKVHQCQLSFALITNIKEGSGEEVVGKEEDGEGWGGGVGRRRGGHM